MNIINGKLVGTEQEMRDFCYYCTKREIGLTDELISLIHKPMCEKCDEASIEAYYILEDYLESRGG